MKTPVKKIVMEEHEYLFPADPALIAESQRKSLAWHRMSETLNEAVSEMDAQDLSEAIQDLVRWLPLADRCPGCGATCWPVGYDVVGHKEHVYSCHECVTDWTCWWSESEWNECTVLIPTDPQETS